MTLNEWSKEARRRRRDDIAKGVDALAAECVAERSVNPLHVEVLTAAGFDPDRTVTDYEGEDWGLETHGDLWDASIYRHVPLKYLTDDDVNLLLYWGACAEPLVVLAMHYLEQDPFHATSEMTQSLLLTNAASALYPGDHGYDPEPYRARLAAVCEAGRAMLANGRAKTLEAARTFDLEEAIRLAEVAPRRYPDAGQGHWRRGS